MPRASDHDDARGPEGSEAGQSGTLEEPEPELETEASEEIDTELEPQMDPEPEPELEQEPDPEPEADCEAGDESEGMRLPKLCAWLSGRQNPPDWPLSSFHL